MRVDQDIVPGRTARGGYLNEKNEFSNCNCSHELTRMLLENRLVGFGGSIDIVMLKQCVNVVQLLFDLPIVAAGNVCLLVPAQRRKSTNIVED